MIFQQQAPPPGLARFVTRLWYLDTPRNARYEKILPLPFAHLIVNLSDPYRLVDADGRVTTVEHAFLAGLRRDFLISELPHRLRHVGAEFTPVGLDALTTGRGIGRAGELTAGRVLPAAEIFAEATGWASLLDGLSPAAAAEALGGLLADGPPPSPEPMALAVQEALDLDPDTGIEDLARRLHTSRRTLSQRFRRATGLTPKSYALVLRFHRLVAAAQTAAPPEWAVLAASSGYYDQPHVIREFRRFSGWTPAEHQRRIADFGPAEAYFVPLQELPEAIRPGQARR